MDRPADVVLVVDEPPSTNALFVAFTRGGKPARAKSKPYAAWCEAAAWQVAQQRAGDQIDGPYHMRITVPKQRGRDLANNEKAVSDLMQSAGVIRNDLGCVRLVMERDTTREPGRVLVEIWAA